MKNPLMILLIVLLFLLQYRLWFSHDGLPSVLYLNRTVEIQRSENSILEERNKMLAAEVTDLKEGRDALEERARSELGMIRKGETFIQIIEEAKSE
ncbi:MAG: cell division protein FtsB [Piscirickettsiaceae bacterium]|nr:cell division protein FtsB [Piscirickettsiaceae bacterium]